MTGPGLSLGSSSGRWWLQVCWVLLSLTGASLVGCRDRGPELGSSRAALSGAPAIASVSPVRGPVNALVTIRGSGFGAFSSRAANQVLFNGVPGVVLAGGWTDTEIKVAVPLSATSGPLTVRLADAADVTGPAFAVTRPEISSLSAAAGPRGSVLIVHGASFGDGTGTQPGAVNNTFHASITATLQVTFNGVPGIVLDRWCCGMAGWSDTAIKLVVPRSATSGPVAVSIRGTDVDPQTGVFRHGFVTATGPAFAVTEPVITSLSASGGPRNSVLIVRGSHFGNGAGDTSATVFTAGSGAVNASYGMPVHQALQVTFDGVPGLVLDRWCCGMVGWSDTAIKVVVPRSARTGTVAVKIHAADLDVETGTLTPSFITATGPSFTVVEPRLTGLSAMQGPRGSVVIARGSGFGDGAGNTSATVFDAGTGAVNANYLGARPIYQSLQVLFNGVPGIVLGRWCCGMEGWSDTAIKVVVPASATTGPVAVSMFAADLDLETGAVSGGFVRADGPSFTVKDPVITSLSAPSGPRNSVLIVRGSDFGDGNGNAAATAFSAGSGAVNALLNVPIYQSLQVTFAGAPAPVLGRFCCGMTGWSNDAIKVVVPRSARGGAVAVKMYAADIDLDTGALAGRFVSSNDRQFEVVTPTISSISPAGGPGGTLVTVTGTGFGDGEGNATPSVFTEGTGAMNAVVAGSVQQSLQVLFNGVPGSVQGAFCCGLQGWKPSSIAVFAPAGVTTGNISLRTYAADLDLSTGALPGELLEVSGPVYSATSGTSPPSTSCVGSLGAPESLATDLGACSARIDNVNRLGGGCTEGSGGLASCLFDGLGARELSLGDHVVTVKGTAQSGAASSCQSYLSVSDRQGPSVTCPGPKVVECAGPQTPVSVMATCSDNCGACSAACAAGPYRLGATAVPCTGTDQAGNTGSCQAQVTVRDTVAPSLTLAASPATLWPPNHELIAISLDRGLIETCDPHPTLTCTASSSEPDEGLGDGDQPQDVLWEKGRLLLRAERSGTGPGRVYTITCTAADASGNTTTVKTTVTVPRSQTSRS